MQIDATIRRFRERHQSLFRDVVRVERTTDPVGSFDDQTGEMTYGAAEVIYEGIGNLRETARWEGVERTTGDEELIAERAQLRLPHGTPISENDMVIVVSSVHDSGHIGFRYRIIHVLFDDWQVVRRAVLERIAPIDEEQVS